MDCRTFPCISMLSGISGGIVFANEYWLSRMNFDFSERIFATIFATKSGRYAVIIRADLFLRAACVLIIKKRFRHISVKLNGVDTVLLRHTEIIAVISTHAPAGGATILSFFWEPGIKVSALSAQTCSLVSSAARRRQNPA